MNSGKQIHITGELFVKVCDALSITADQLNNKVITNLQEFIVYNCLYENESTDEDIRSMWEEWLNK